MRRANPIFIPRNHLVEAALNGAVRDRDDLLAEAKEKDTQIARGEASGGGQLGSARAPERCDHIARGLCGARREV
jgi:uncharacterized protein YdiU (UPF0061 family)